MILKSNLIILILTIAYPAYGQIVQDSNFGKKIEIDSISNITTISNGITGGNNLFYSFSDFNVDSNRKVFFIDPGVNNIVALITGKNRSNIDGTLGVSNGGANLFLINPNGIVFGNNSKLELQGSFLASTASSVIFDDGSTFNITEGKVPPLLNVSIPVGLRFGELSGSIQLSGKDLQISPGRTLALVGGDITIDGGSIFSPGTRIEIGSVNDNNVVKISSSPSSFILNYDNVNSFKNIYLNNNAFITTGDDLGGDIQLWGKRISISGDSFGNSSGITVATGLPTPGNITVNSSGSITINASESVDLNNGELTTQSLTPTPSGFIKINTQRLSLSNGSIIDSSSGAKILAGNIEIKAPESIFIGENSSIISNSFRGGFAGNIELRTGKLILENSAIRVSARSGGKSGNVTIYSNYTFLNNSEILSNTNGGEGNIFVSSESIVLRHKSQILTNGSRVSPGGNITFNTGVLVALENSDITANSVGDFGGQVSISARGIFGTQFRENLTPESDITATSALGPNFSGTVELNITAVDPSQGLVELPTTVVDPSILVAQNPCKRASSSEFTRSGRGGLPPSLSQDLNGESIQVGLVEPVNISAEKPEPKSDSKPASSVAKSSSQIVPAQGWIYNDKGEVVLVAYNSAVTGSQRLQLVPKGCPVL